MTEDDVISIARQLRLLSGAQRGLVKDIVKQLTRPFNFKRDSKSDWVTPTVLQELGDTLRVHHALSRQALSKDRFEYAFERALKAGGLSADLGKNRTNRGHDIVIENIPVSLKTEAASKIKKDFLHVSKWMELGKGEWKLPLLRDAFLGHLKNYERVFMMRCLGATAPTYHYELVEIPKPLLLEAANCRFELKNKSKQKPKPGYGYVEDKKGSIKYALYFDGGTERKLQIKDLRKDLCKVHATWEFESAPLA